MLRDKSPTYFIEKNLIVHFLFQLSFRPFLQTGAHLNVNPATWKNRDPLAVENKMINVSTASLLIHLPFSFPCWSSQRQWLSPLLISAPSVPTSNRVRSAKLVNQQ